MSLFDEVLTAVRAVDPALLDPRRVTDTDESPLWADAAPAAVVSDGDALTEPRYFPDDGQAGDSEVMVALWVPLANDPDWAATTLRPVRDAVHDALRPLISSGAAPNRRLRVSVQRRGPRAPYLANVAFPVYRGVVFTMTERVGSPS